MKLSLLSLVSIIVFWLFSAPHLAQAAACCGGGFAAPSLIAGDDEAQLTASYSFTEVTVNHVDTHGFWREWDDHQQVQTIRLEGAHLLSDRWQAGFSIPFTQRSWIDETHSGLGDTSLSLGYEFLPDWDYNPIRPKGIGFIQVTLPTGKSRAESENGGLDSRGNGFWAIGVGTLLTKSISDFDLFTSVEVHRSFARHFSNSFMSGELKPGYGGTLSLGGGYHFRSLRLGASLAWTYEDPIDIEGESPSTGSFERYATALLSLSYIASDEWSGTLSYADQTWFGSPINTSLGKTVAISLQKRWLR